MTNEEALEDIRHFSSECVDCSYDTGDRLDGEPVYERSLAFTGKFLDSLAKAADALEKQIPKKPKIEKWTNRIPSEQKVYVCPLCGDDWNSDEFGSGMEWCWSCGQAIDWSDDNATD